MSPQHSQHPQVRTLEAESQRKSWQVRRLWVQGIQEARRCWSCGGGWLCPRPLPGYLGLGEGCWAEGHSDLKRQALTRPGVPGFKVQEGAPAMTACVSPYPLLTAGCSWGCLGPCTSDSPPGLAMITSRVPSSVPPPPLCPEAPDLIAHHLWGLRGVLALLPQAGEVRPNPEHAAPHS